jgi:DNA-binding XRE family transcriptional regulator
MAKHQIINVDGRPALVVVPLAEWKRLMARLEDKEDARLANDRLANPGEPIPDSVLGPILEGAQPVKVFREWRGMSQTDLAKAADTSSVYISQIERRERHASRKLRAKLAAALRVDEELLADDEPKG